MLKETAKKLNVYGIIIFFLILFLSVLILGARLTGKTAFAAGEEPFDARARIGFKAENFYYNEFFAEENNGAVTVRVYVSEVQNVDIPFTLTETRFGGGSSLFVFASGYTLPAGSAYNDVTFNQGAQAESGSGVRLSDIYIHCDTPTVTVGDVEYYGEEEPCDDDFLAVVYDKTGDAELIVGGFPTKSLESDGSISSMFIRSGSVSSTTDAYYCIKDYDTTNTKELLFDNYNSVLSFEAGEREKALELKFFDNDRLNLREAFKFEITSGDGISQLFDIAMRRYIEDGEEYLIPFAIEDDEPYSDKYIAQVQYYQPGETDPKFEISEGGDTALQINVYGLRDNTLPAFRVYYTVGINYTAEYGVDYTLGGNYRQDINLGYIEVPAGGNTYTGEIMFFTLDDSIYTGTRTVDIKFYLNNVQNVLLQPLDSVRFEITDNEFLPSNNTISWSPHGTLNGYGTFQDNVLSLNYNNKNDWIVIGVDTDYMGTLPLNIPVVFEDITAKNGREYYQESPYGLLVFRRDFNKYGIDINRRSNFKFTGTRRFKVSILEEGLTTGLSITGTNFIYVDMVGRIEDDYNYVEYTEAQIDDIFSIGKNEALSFKLRREETAIETTYIDLTRNEQGAFIEDTHIAAGIFPYEVVWAENEKEKLITIEFLAEWSSSINSPYASGYLSFLNGSKQPFNDVYGENQRTSVPVTLSEGNSSAYYYFQGQESLSYVRYEYLYSSGSSLRIPVYREFVSPQAAQAAYTTVSYNLETIVYDPFDPKQPAEIGTHIDNLSGTLFFHGEETVQYINVTVPYTVGFAPGSKYVNLVLSDPGEKTYILSNRQDIYRYSLAQIKITNDITPVLNYVDLTTTTVEEDSYETTSINPLEYVRKEFDSFKLELIPYETDETPYQTDLYYYFDIYFYSIYDLSTVGVEVFVNGSKVQCAGVSPYFYDGEFFGGSSATYGYAYVTSVLVNKDNPFITYTIKYSEIAQAGLSFLSTSLLLKATCPYFMNGWETYQKQLWLNACEEGASEEASLSVARVVTGGATNVQAGDIVYITVTRSSQDAAAATMFYESADYGIRSVPYFDDAVYYFEPLNTLITFAPYERSKTVPFVTRDRPEGYAWDEAAATAVINLCYYQDHNIIFDELTVKVCEELGETVINAEVVLLSERIYVHKPSGEQDDTITIKFIFDKIYDSDIEFNLEGMHQRIGNLTVTLPAGQTEIEHHLTFNEDNITEKYMWIDISMTAELITDFDNTTLALTVPEGLSVVVSSRNISDKKFNAEEPGAYSMYESDSQGISLEIIADRWQYPQYWPDINAYVRLGGTAVYGTDYYIDYESKGNHNYFDVTTGIVLIWKGTDRAIIHIYPIDNATSGQAKTIEVTILDYFYGYPAYPQTFNLSILDDEYFGDFYLSIGEDANRGGLTTIIPRRENNSRSSFTINYEVEEVFGVYGTDYQLQILNSHTNLPKSGTVTFQADIYYIIIHIVPYTELGKGAAFYFRINKDNEEACSIQDSEIFASARSFNNSGDYVARTVNGDTELDRWVSNYNQYLQDYTKYYKHYRSGENVWITSVILNDNGPTEGIYMHFYADGRAELSSSIRAGSYAVPSGISLNNWRDINGDGRKELIFVANLDSCFGGATEFASLNMHGVYALDITNGHYTTIFEFREGDEAKHLDVYISDLKGDGCPEVVVFSTPWADTLLRRDGGNELYIINNVEGAFALENAYDGNDVINGSDLTLYAACVKDKFNSYDRNYIEVSYYSTSSRTGGINYGVLVELSSAGNARMVYFQGAYESTGTEGSSYEIKVYNVTGTAGEATIIFTSESAVYGRDYIPQTQTISFAQGEYQKTVILKTLNNHMPNDFNLIFFHIESEDFTVLNRNYDSYGVGDISEVNKGVAYTVMEEFDSSYTSPQYITGDRALFAIYPLTIDGVRCASIENELYDARFSVRYNNYVFSDSDNDGLIEVPNILSLWEPNNDNYKYFTVVVDFLLEGTDTVFSTKKFYVDYFYYRTESSYHEIFNEVEISSTIFMGKLTIKAQSFISMTDMVINGRFALTFISTINDRPYTFYSDSLGRIDVQINYPSVQGIFEYSYTINQLTIASYSYNSEVYELRSYKETMGYPVSVIDSVRQSLLRGVLVEVMGINTNYSFSALTDAETGALILPNVAPLKSYRITVNGDYGISYFEKFSATFDATVDEPHLSISLQIRTAGASLDMLAVDIFRGVAIRTSLQALSRINNCAGNHDRIISYLYGNNEVLDSNDRLLLKYLLGTMYTGAISSPSRVFIQKDILFSSDFPTVYKSLAKNPDDITVISYRYNPEFEFGDTKVLLGRHELTSDMSRHFTYELEVSSWFGIPEEQTHIYHFYTFAGYENCILDLEINSDAYLGGKKSVPLASFGTGLGSFLLEPVQNMFSSIETAPVPANMAFLNGMSFMLGFADIDFAFDYDEENLTFSLYMGASKDLYEKSHGMDYGDIGRPTLAQLREAKSAGLGTGRGQAGLGVGLGGKMIFKYVDGDWLLRGGEIYFSVNASYNYTKYILLPVISIPAFFSATISLEIETTIYFDWNEAEEYTEVTGDLAIELAVEIECGIGIKGFLSASVYGRAGIEVIIQLESGATKLTLYVEGGVRIQIIFWKYTYSFGRAEWSTQSDGYVDRDAAFQSLQLSQLNKSTDYTGVAALYSASGDLMMGAALGADGQAEEILIVSNIYEKGAPKIAEMNDGTKMIAWINYDSTRGADNAEVINYIYFDGDSWSEVAAADDTLTADLDLDIKIINGNLAIICTEVKEELEEGSTISERLLKSDVAVLVFNPETLTFSKTILTNNLFNDRQALFDYDSGNGIAVVYRSENTNITDDMTINDFLCGENADNKLYYSIYNSGTGSWDQFLLFQYALPAVSTMSLKIVGGIAYIALECDNDDNFDTTSDREIFLLQYIFATGQTRMQQLTDNDVQDVAPSLLNFKDKAFLAYRSGDDVRYWYENNVYLVWTLPQTHTNFDMFASDDYAIMLSTMPVEGVSQVFASVMDGETMVFSAPAQITFSDKPARDPVLAFSGSEITVYYCADTYTLLSSDGDEYTFSVTSDITQTAFSLYSDLSVEVLAPDYSTMRPGEEFTFTARIYNSGTQNVAAPWLKIYNSETLLLEVTAGLVRGNGYLDVPVSVILPSGRASLIFEVGKDGLNEDTLDNLAEVEVLLTNISIDKDYNITWNEDGTLTVIINIINLSAVDTENITVSLTAYSNASSVFASTVIPLLSAGETRQIMMAIAKEDVRFNANNDFWMKAYALTVGKDIYTVADDDYDATDNVRGLRTARPLFADGSTLALLNQDLNLTIGGNGYVGFVYTGDGEIEVASSDLTVASIDGNRVSALKVGSATITVSDGEVTKTFLVSVDSNQYTVTFKDIDGTVLKTETLTVGAAITAPANPVKTGYTFGGWDITVAETMPEENVNYTAIWVLNAPVIAAQSGYSGTYDGGEHSVTVAASHTLGNVAYQWYKGAISIENLLEGQTGSTLLVKNISDSGTYYCRITYTDGTQTKYTDSAAIMVSITDIAKGGLSGGAIAGITVGATLFATLAGYIALFIAWKKKGTSLMFLRGSFRKVNKLFFKTELNDIEKLGEKD